MRGFDLSLDEHEENTFISINGCFMYPIYETFSDHEVRRCVHTKMVVVDEEDGTNDFDIFINQYGVNSLYINDGVFSFVLL